MFLCRFFAQLFLETHCGKQFRWIHPNSTKTTKLIPCDTVPKITGLIRLEDSNKLHGNSDSFRLLIWTGNVGLSQISHLLTFN
jgi:hypothetical protein